MKTFIDEKVQKIKKRNNSTNKNLNINNRLFPKDLNKNNFNARLSDSNIDFNRDEIMNNDLRCLNCYLIPFLTINTPSHSINLNCNFGHSTKLSVEEYLEKGYENNFSNLSCNKCKTKIFNNEKDFIYCKECSELLCLNCVKKHNNLYEDTHHMIHLDKFDSTCILHNESYDYFCLDCKKNICQYCFDEFHNEHNLVDLDDINLKRKEVKKIKENYMKEKENYLNVPKILNELIDKLRDEIDNIVANLKSELKFKESIINTYENKVDNYNAIMNLKNLEFNIEPFMINSNLSIMENITNLFKYLNLNDVKFVNKKINLRKSPDRIKEKKKKIIPKYTNTKSASVNKIVEEGITNNGNDTQDTNKVNNNNIISVISENKKRNNNSLKRSSKVYKKNFINRRINNKYFNSTDNTNNSQNNSNINNVTLNDENDKKNKINEVEALNSQNNENKNIINSDNEEKDKKNLSRITEENSNNQNITNTSNIKEVPEIENIKKDELSSPKKREKDKEDKEEKEEKDEQNSNLDNTIKVKKEEKSKKFNKSINNRIRFRNNHNDYINSNTNNNSTNNINYIKSEAPNLKMLVKTNKNRYFDKNLDIDNSNIQKLSKDNKELSSQSQKALNIVTTDPSTMIKQINDNQSQHDTSKSRKIINDNKMVENISKEKKVSRSKKTLNIRANNKKIKEEDKENKKEEEEEEDEEDEEDNEDSNEESESDKEKKKEEDNNIKKKKGSVKFKTKIKKKSYKKSKTKKVEQESKNINDNINKEIHLDENDTNLKTRKINKKAVSSEKSEINKKIFKKTKNNSKTKEKDKEKEKEKEKDKEDFIQKKNENKTLVRDQAISEFKPNGSALKIKEADNTICSMLEIRDNIFACGFLLGHIDVYDVNYLNCLLTINEHKSRVTNMVLLKDKSILSSSFDHTMKKIRITNNNSYVVDYVFDTLKNIVYKGIEITNNDIVSISFRGNIDIFKKNENNNNYSNFLSHEIANEEIYNVIELYQNKELAFATDECLRFFSIDAYQNIGNVHLLEFAKGNNLILINKNMLAVLLKHHIGLVNISQRQCISKISLGEIGKTECFCILKDNTILIGISNNEKDNKNVEFMFKQYGIKINKCKLIAEKLQVFEKKGKEDYGRITSLIELRNGVIAYGTAGFEELRLVGNISIID